MTAFTKLTPCEALECLTDALKSDHGYAWSWQCNIAMAAVDAGVEHKLANKGAANFMQLCFGVDVTQFPEYQSIMGTPDA